MTQHFIQSTIFDCIICIIQYIWHKMAKVCQSGCCYVTSITALSEETAYMSCKTVEETRENKS